jgi:hypothetical protein
MGYILSVLLYQLCRKTIFDGVAHFGSTFFYDDADFKLSKFTDDVDFGGARFYGHAKFPRVKFIERAYFKNASFWKNLILTGARGFEIRLKDARFRGGSCKYLSYNQITMKIRKMEKVPACPWDETCYWTKARLWSKTCIILDNSSISNLYIKWDTIKDHFAYDAASYIALVKNFKDLGEYRDADLCYYQYRKIDQETKKIRRSKFINLLEDFYYGYGVYPFKAIKANFLIIIIFALVYWLFIGTFNLNSIADIFYNSTIIFTANSKSIQWDPWYLNWLGLFEGLLGWLLMALFLVTLGRNRPR